MTFARIRSLAHRRRSLPWLLALLLWLPVAQWAAASHALVHLASVSAPDGSERPAHLPGVCDTCVVAAAIGGAAPQSAPAIALLPQLPHARPLATSAAGACLPFAAAYRSRAPPSLHA
jgi:hypothetical protein